MATVTVIVSAHNRRQQTLSCFDALFGGNSGTHHIRVVLTDDGSTDGTADAVRASFPSVEIVAGNGALYWNRGMLAAWRHALTCNTDYYLWLNDDTELRPGALDALIALQQTAPPKTIVVGRIVDSEGKPIYGALRRVESDIKLGGVRIWRRIRTELAPPDEGSSDTFQGNCVLMPSSVVDDVGLLDPVFWHSEGDTDYGYRAKAAGYDIRQAVEPVAIGTYNDAFEQKRSRLSFDTWRYVFTHPKGRRFSETSIYIRRYYGPSWRLRLLFFYARMLLVQK
ncbi:glycosyltransferase family 2 protein [Phenylobacterium sp. VNQ135]|uniref:glycosyltransferase family 2 protein n=1 Tax=Phenylobacterium sp. VNQ135 TaxID=3400922 RepID=UPI003C128FBD